MAKYVWTVKNRFGNTVVREVNANTIDESKSMLLAQGYTDLILKSDEIMDAAARMSRPVRFLGKELKITEAEKLKYRNRPAPTFLSALGQGIKNTRSRLVLIFVVAAYAIYSRNLASIILIGIALIAWLAFLMVLRLPSIYFHRLHKAADWSRWSEVLQIVAMLKRIEKIHFTSIPPLELGRYRAKALAGMGRLPEALEEFSQYKDRPECPGWLYKVFVSEIYGTAKKYDKALEYSLEATQEKPTPVMYLDLTNRYLRHKNDLVEARVALDEAEKSTIPDVAMPYHLRCRGILAWLEKDYGSAKQELEASLEIMQKTPHGPGRDGHISIVKAYLCCVLAKLGNTDAARKNFMEAEKYLVATGETELLENCKEAIMN